MKNDKTLHVYAGILCSIVITALFFFFTNMPILGVYLLALSSGILAGALKEWVWDKALKMGQFSYQDFYHTIWGSVVGTLASVALTQWILAYHAGWVS